jgi:hypothetical protein
MTRDAERRIRLYFDAGAGFYPALLLLSVVCIFFFINKGMFET